MREQPYDESILAPFLLRWPQRFGRHQSLIDTPLNAPDIMPTLLGLCGLPKPSTVEGFDFSGHLSGESVREEDAAAVIACYAPFAGWDRKRGGLEYRGIRTARFTYVRSLAGPWLLFDNDADPFQLKNLVGDREGRDLTSELDALLTQRLQDTGDEFLPTGKYLEKWGYRVDDRGCVPYEL